MSNQISRHGEADFDPTRYEFYGWFDNTPELGFTDGNVMEMLRWATEERNAFAKRLYAASTSRFSKVGQCAHCGTAIRYHCVYLDTRDGAVIAIGETCSAERMGLSKSDWAGKKAKLDRSRELARAGEKFIAIREEWPVAAALMVECLEAATGDWDAFKAFFPDFVLDISRKAQRYGSISPAQAAAVEKWVPLHREKVAKEAAEKAEQALNAKPVPTGKLVVEGEIVRAYWYDNGYDGVMKMIVKGDGWKVWGTLPRVIEDSVENVNELAGRTIRFNATVTASDDDESFGFFKRPSKAEITAP